LDQGWQQNLHTSSVEPPRRSIGRSFKLGSIRRSQGIPVWIAVCAAVVVMLCWNWQLVVVTSIGAISMLIAYAAQGWNWDGLFLRVQQFIHNPHRRLIAAVGTGTLTVLVTAIMIAIWGSTENHWLASASLLQLIATLLTLMFLAKQAVDRWVEKQQIGIDHLVSRLGATDDLERLIAVRQLAQCVQQSRLPFNQEQAIIEYCQVLLSREAVPAVRDAALDTLEALNYKAFVASSPRPVP